MASEFGGLGADSNWFEGSGFILVLWRMVPSVLRVVSSRRRLRVISSVESRHGGGQWGKVSLR